MQQAITLCKLEEINLDSNKISKRLENFLCEFQGVKTEFKTEMAGPLRAALCLSCESAFLFMSVTPPEVRIL